MQPTWLQLILTPPLWIPLIETKSAWCAEDLLSVHTRSHVIYLVGRNKETSSKYQTTIVLHEPFLGNLQVLMKFFQIWIVWIRYFYSVRFSWFRLAEFAHSVSRMITSYNKQTKVTVNSFCSVGLPLVSKIISYEPAVL